MMICPKCQQLMKEDCYLKDSAQALTDLNVVEKTDDLKKIEYPLKVAICKSCGYVELYIKTDSHQ
jgi:hypothetical protein